MLYIIYIFGTDWAKKQLNLNKVISFTVLSSFASTKI
jgi:hypothetical protein